MTIPKAELKAAFAGVTTAVMVRRNLGDRYGGATFCTDSTICLYWITQDDCLPNRGQERGNGDQAILQHQGLVPLVAEIGPGSANCG